MLSTRGVARLLTGTALMGHVLRAGAWITRGVARTQSTPAGLGHFECAAPILEGLYAVLVAHRPWLDVVTIVYWAARLLEG